MADLVIRVRPARAGDHAALQLVYQRASLSNPGDRDGLIAHPEFLRLDPGLVGRGRTWVAALPDDAIIGFATTSPAGDSVLELDDLFVDPDWRRHGAARQLIERIVDQAAAEGVDRIEVTGNPHAMSFYRAVGFTGTATVQTPLGAGIRLRLSIGMR